MRALLGAWSATLLVSACVMSGGEGGSLATVSSVSELARANDIVVVGTITTRAGTRNLARGRDPARDESASVVVLAQDYRVAVEEVLKGRAPAEIVLSIASAHGLVGQQIRQDSDFLPPAVGARYVLFLKRAWPGAESFAAAYEPHRFRLSDFAAVESRWPGATSAFPPLRTDVFLAQVREASAASR